jgi:acylphosphatase
MSRIFVQQRVQGVDFVDLTRDDIKELGITQVGVIKAIERAKSHLLSSV